MEKQYDVIIVGGGIVGASLALLLASLSKTIAMIEAMPINKTPSANEDKAIVLSHSSRIILEALGIWSLLTEEISFINQIHVSDQGHFGGSRILAEDEKLPALGYVLPE